MKNVLSTFLALSLLLLASCSVSPDKVLPKKDGIWNADFRVKTIFADTTVNDASTAVFTFKDESLTITSADTSFTSRWIYDKESEKLRVVTSSITFVYDVKDLKRDSETWVTTTRTTPPFGGGTAYTTEETIFLTRKK